MFKLLVFACLLAFAFAAPKPSLTGTLYGGYAPAISTYSTYGGLYPYSSGYYGNYQNYGYSGYPYIQY